MSEPAASEPAVREPGDAVSLVEARRALLRGLVGALVLGVAGRLALEVWVFALAGSAFALLHFHTLPAAALPYVGAVVGAWLLPASLVEARVWGRLRPGGVVVVGLLVAAAGVLLATVQGTYTYALVHQGAPGEALGHAFVQAREVVSLIPAFPRDTATLLTTFALPFPLVLWFRRGATPRPRQLVGLVLLASALALAFYVPLLPEASTKVVGGQLIRVTPGEHLLGWWLLLVAYALALALAAAGGDALDALWDMPPPTSAD